MSQQTNRTRISPTKPELIDKSPAMDVCTRSQPHELERLIQTRLQSHAGLRFSRLMVHQCPQGVCLEGTLETNEEGIDLCELVGKIAGVKAINHVVMRSTARS